MTVKVIIGFYFISRFICACHGCSVSLSRKLRRLLEPGGQTDSLKVLKLVILVTYDLIVTILIVCCYFLIMFNQWHQLLLVVQSAVCSAYLSLHVYYVWTIFSLTALRVHDFLCFIFLLFFTQACASVACYLIPYMSNEAKSFNVA